MYSDDGVNYGQAANFTVQSGAAAVNVAGNNLFVLWDFEGFVVTSDCITWNVGGGIADNQVGPEGQTAVHRKLCVSLTPPLCKSQRTLCV